jgi:hypothetical protein
MKTQKGFRLFISKELNNKLTQPKLILEEVPKAERFKKGFGRLL